MMCVSEFFNLGSKSEAGRFLGPHASSARPRARQILSGKNFEMGTEALKYGLDLLKKPLALRCVHTRRIYGIP